MTRTIKSPKSSLFHVNPQYPPVFLHSNLKVSHRRPIAYENVVSPSAVVLSALDHDTSVREIPEFDLK